MAAHLLDVAGALPATELTNDQLDREFPEWNVQLTAQRMGVRSRFIAAEDETALDLAERACHALFERHPALREQLDAIVFCTQSADYIMPSNACLLHGRLQLSEQVSVWDLNHACSGYIYALGLARSLILSGSARNTLVVTADTYSKYINPRDRSARVLFGDGAAASWGRRQASSSDATPTSHGGEVNGPGLRAPLYGTAGALYDKFIVPAGGCRLPRSAETSLEIADDSGNFRSQQNIHMAGQDILNFVSTKIPDHVRGALAQYGLQPDDIDLFLFHQASGVVLDLLTRLLRLPEERVFRHLEHIGNTVSSSIPLAMREALDTGRVQSGDRLLLCGFGVGLSWGTTVVEL